MKDKQGRDYAKISKLKKGDKIELDVGFGCVRAKYAILEEDERGLFFRCAADRHYLSGQTENSEDLIGIYETPQDQP